MYKLTNSVQSEELLVNQFQNPHKVFLIFDSLYLKIHLHDPLRTQNLHKERTTCMCFLDIYRFIYQLCMYNLDHLTILILDHNLSITVPAVGAL